MLYAENKVSADELRRNEWAFWGVAACVLFFFVGSDAWWGSESYFAEIVREMVQSTKWFCPTFNQQAVTGVPLPLLWEGALAGRIFGVSEWTLRGVVVLNALGLLAGTVLLARQFFNRRVALLAGILLLGSCGFLYASRLFLGVIPAAACGIWALYAFVVPWKKGKFLRPVVVTFFLLLALFFGTFYAVLPSIAGGIAIRLIGMEKEKPTRKTIALWSALLTGCIALAFWLHPYGVMPPKYPDFSGGFSHRLWRVIGFDAVRVFFPWSLWGIIALAEVFFTFPKQESNFRSFAVATVAVWCVALFPSIENWRQMVYLLPLLAILTAAVLTEEWKIPFVDRTVDVLACYLAMIIGAVAVAAVIWIPILQVLFKVEISTYITILVPAAGLTTQCFLLFDKHAAQRCALPEHCGGAVLAGLMLVTAALCLIRPNLAEFRSGRSFIEGELAPQLKNLSAKAMLYYGDQPDASLLYYGKFMHRLNATGTRDRKEVLREFLAENRTRFVAVIADADKAMEDEISAVGAEFDLEWKTPSARERVGTFSSGGRRLVLYFGNVDAKKETMSTSATEEKP